MNNPLNDATSADSAVSSSGAEVAETTLTQEGDPSVNVQPPADNREVVDLDQPAKKGKKKEIEPTIGCSTCPSLEIDRDGRCEACADEYDFLEHMADEHPEVQPDTALWRFYRHCYFFTRFADLNKEAGPPPPWAVEASHMAKPAWSVFRSDWLDIRLRRHPGLVRGMDGSTKVVPLAGTEEIEMATASVRLVQYPNERNPFIEMDRAVCVDGKMASATGALYRFEVPEAKQLADALHLLLDVARESGASA